MSACEGRKGEGRKMTELHTIPEATAMGPLRGVNIYFHPGRRRA
jgi:hypothetical protein